jgi:hypothetical protein
MGQKATGVGCLVQPFPNRIRYQRLVAGLVGMVWRRRVAEEKLVREEPDFY